MEEAPFVVRQAKYGDGCFARIPLEEGAVLYADKPHAWIFFSFDIDGGTNPPESSSPQATMEATSVSAANAVLVE